MSQTYAVIDLGTNSVLLLIGNIGADKRVEALHHAFRVTRIGEGLQLTGRLSDAAMNRTINVLAEYLKIIKRFNPFQVKIIATAALRTASNSDDFIQRVVNELGIKIEIISSEDEAKYGYFGALDGLRHVNEKILVMDVGGGSTELTIGDNDSIHKYQSLSLGVVTLREIMGMKDTLCSGDRLKAIAYIKLKLEELKFLGDIAGDIKFVATGGTMSSIAAIREKMIEYDPLKINGYRLSRDEIWKMYYTLNGMTIEERKGLPGLESGREDVILYGLLIYLTMLELRRIETVIVSDRGIRYGMLKRMAGRVF
ncbi:MAG: hypothetical protein AB7T22_01360 [Calditrichaceae bacterium]